jgi:hypothetical protein
MLAMVEAGKPYPGRCALAKVCGVSEGTVQAAIDSQDRLRDWQAGGRLPDGPPPKKRLAARARLRTMMHRGGRFPGCRALARLWPYSQETIRAAINPDPELLLWSRGEAVTAAGGGIHSGAETVSPALSADAAAPAANAGEVSPAMDSHLSMTKAQVAAGFQGYKALTKFLDDHPEVPTSRPLSARTGKPDPHRRTVHLAMLIKAKNAEDERADHANEEFQEEVADRLARECEAKRKAKASAAKHVPLGSRAT